MIDIGVQSGLDIQVDTERIELVFGPDVVHPPVERRWLDDVRPVLSDPAATGPNHLYSVYMDIARADDLPALREQGLLYGAVIYNTGTIGDERLRSQGHVHSADPRTGLRFAEAYEFWTGRAYVYLQKECDASVTRAVAVTVAAGDKVIVPSGWVHLVVTLGEALVSFGAWCARASGLEYECLRTLQGPAYYFRRDGSPVRNPHYSSVPDLEYARPADIPHLDVPMDRPIYTSWRERPERFEFLPRPELGREAWARL